MEIAEKIRKTLHSDYREEWAIEGEFQVALSLAIIKKMDVYVYGAGQDIWSVVSFFRKEGIVLKGIIDSNVDKSGSVVNGVKIINCEELKANVEKPENTYVFIWTYCKNFRILSIFDVLKRSAIDKFYIIKPEERYILTAIQHELAWNDANRPQYYIEHENEIVSFAEMLEDTRSQDTLVEYIRAYVECGYYRGENIATKFKYFLDTDGQCLYTHLQDEVWINCGANYGDNIFTYFRNGFDCKKIYAIEADNGISIALRENIELLPDSYKEKIIICNNLITVDSKWEFLEKKEKVSLINADIEGAELSLLRSLKKKIVEDRPVLSLCLYHLKEDLVEIPSFLKKTLNDYKFYLRKYACYEGAYKGTYELVLYCVPIERVVM